MPENYHKYSLELIESLKNLPENPGVYEMRNNEDETLYVGKAKNLKSRVKSYFLASANHSARIQKLIEKVHHIEWTQTSSEVEALLLETNLIKQKSPKFNILMRDDKNFCYIKVSIQEDFPRITLVRRVLKDGAKYFGPKTSSSSVRKTIDLLQDIFRFRSSTMDIKQIAQIPENSQTTASDNNQKKVVVEISKTGNQKVPCLNYHLGKCDAPCVGQISKEEYSQKTSAILKFLKGEYKEILEIVKTKMMLYAKEEKFNLAAKMRDKMLAIESISEKQIISAPDEFSADIIGGIEKFGHAFFHLFSLRDGKIINSETFSVRLPEKNSESSPHQLEEALKSFLQSHPERVADSPKTIILDTEIFKNSENSLQEEIDIWEKFFSEKFGHATEISLPQKAKRKKLLELAIENAESYAKRHSSQFIKQDDDSEKILEILQKKLQMRKFPKRMECYDISHFSGQKTVASMVVFEDGKPKNNDYRSFNIVGLSKGEIDDFSSLQEATARRLKRLPEKTPEQWEIKKLKIKKDFEEISQSLRENLNEELLQSQFFYDIKKVEKTSEKTSEKKILKCAKKIESSFYSLLEVEQEKTKKGVKKGSKKTQKFLDTLFVRKHHLLKRGDIFMQNTENTEIKCQKFLLTQVLEKMKCEEYSIYSNNTEVQKFLEQIGFVQVSDYKFSGKFHSSKNDSFQRIPDVMIIDGGKGQLSSVAKSLLESPFCDDITLCSIAKREEEIFVFSSLTGEISLTEIQKKSPEGHLLQRIRDEAHRFAITKNRTGREKESMKSVLDEVQGLGPKMKKILKKKGGVPYIRSASDEELLEIISQKVLVQLREKL